MMHGKATNAAKGDKGCELVKSYDRLRPEEAKIAPTTLGVCSASNYPISAFKTSYCDGQY